MGVIDVEQLLKEVSQELPCGSDLEYDPEFGAMERAAQGRAAQQVGDSVAPGIDADWPEVQRIATELIRRTKDVRVAIYLTRALVQTSGYPGLSDGLALLRGLMERYWEPIYPLLDRDSGNDPTFRMNVLADLASRERLVRGLRLVPLINSRRLGRFNLRDIEIATGAIARPSGDSAPVAELSTIEGAFMDGDLAELETTAAAVRTAAEHLTSLEALVADRVGAGRSPDLTALRKTLTTARSFLDQQLTRRGVANAEGAGAAGGGAMSIGSASPIAGEIASREDVIRMLDKACDYFARHEPSSPVPLLLQRAKRLVSKDFVEVVRDLAPGGLSEVRSIGGLDREE